MVVAMPRGCSVRSPRSSVSRGACSPAGSVDVLALLAIVGALIIGEYLAAAIVTVMVGSGQYLEERLPHAHAGN